MILIPIKNLGGAKQRLASVLDQAARTELAQAMLADVLQAICAWEGRPEVSLVTNDAFAVALARKLGFGVIADDANLGETDAIAKATAVCEARGVESTLVIPADIPLITAAELQKIYLAAPSQGSVLVPAADGRGSNAILRRPAALFPLRFGNDSFQPHLAAARATGFTCNVLSLPGIGLDVDSPEDFRRLAIAPGETRAQVLARRWGFAGLPKAVSE